MRVSVSLLLFAAAVSSAVALAQPQPTCKNPTLDFTPEQRVTPKTLVKWRPSDCLMVIETWRNGTDCKKIGVTDSKKGDHTKSRSCDDEGLQDVGVRSGDVTIEQIRGTQKGRIEIKIWPPNIGINKSVFVNVQ